MARQLLPRLLALVLRQTLRESPQIRMALPFRNFINEVRRLLYVELFLFRNCSDRLIPTHLHAGNTPHISTPPSW